MHMNTSKPSASPQYPTAPGIITNIFFLFMLMACFPFRVNAQSTEQLLPNTMDARVAACFQCHGESGRTRPDGFHPRIAGKPAGYLLAQLVHFRDGRRSYEPMRHLLE